MAEGFYKFHTESLNKHKKPLIGDIITTINILRLESDYEQVKILDVNKTKSNQL